MKWWFYKRNEFRELGILLKRKEHNTKILRKYNIEWYIWILFTLYFGNLWESKIVTLYLFMNKNIQRTMHSINANRILSEFPTFYPFVRFESFDSKSFFYQQCIDLQYENDLRKVIKASLNRYQIIQQMSLLFLTTLEQRIFTTVITSVNKHSARKWSGNNNTRRKLSLFTMVHENTDATSY